MRYTTLLALAAAAVSAQSADQEYDSALDMTVDPNSVDPALKANWCRAQQDTCETLCADDPSTNDCDYETIEYDCKCASNSSAPGLQYYTQTMPTFICQTLTDRCVVANTQSQSATEACRENIESLCGKLDPNDADVGSSDEEDQEEDEEDSSSTETSAASTATAPSSTGEEEQAETTSATEDAGDFAAANAAPIFAAIGIFAALF